MKPAQELGRSTPATPPFSRLITPGRVLCAAQAPAVQAPMPQEGSA
jgi:hypothetical protein